MEDDWWCITKNGKIDINPDFKEGMEEMIKQRKKKTRTVAIATAIATIYFGIMYFL